MRVRTSCGYEFNVDDEVELSQVVEVPEPKVEDPIAMPIHQIKFLGQMFGMQKHWHEPTAYKYGAKWGLKHLPVDVFRLKNEDLREFFVQLYNAGGLLYVHYSGTSHSHPEVRFACIHQSLAKELQHLLLRLNIRTRLYLHPQTKKWHVQTSGMTSYLKIRPIIKDTKNPKHLKRMPKLDATVSMDVMVEHGPVTDKVVEILDEELVSA